MKKQIYRTINGGDREETVCVGGWPCGECLRVLEPLDTQKSIAHLKQKKKKKRKKVIFFRSPNATKCFVL